MLVFYPSSLGMLKDPHAWSSAGGGPQATYLRGQISSHVTELGTPLSLCKGYSILWGTFHPSEEAGIPFH